MSDSDPRVRQLQEKGWDFLPTGPNEWEWLKFDSAGTMIARQGDQHWQQDIKEITER